MTLDHNFPVVLNLLKTLVEHESPTHEKYAVDKLGTHITKICQETGAQIKKHPQTNVGDIVEATWYPKAVEHSGTRKQKILMLCHMDTVFPVGEINKMPFIVGEDRIFGPGVADMKGGIVAAIFALRQIVADYALNKRVTILFTSDEETGSRYSRAIIEERAKDSDLVLVLEPGLPDGSLKTQRKGVGTYHLHVKGRAAHAGGAHQDGRNAIEELAHQVLVIQKMTDYSKGTTLNVGYFHGGLAANIVPDQAEAEVDFRITRHQEAKRIDFSMHHLEPILPDTTIQVAGGLNRPPMQNDDTMKQTFAKAKSIAKNIGINLSGAAVGGASDANFVAAIGIPVLDGLGPAGAEYHSEREYIIRCSMTARISLLTNLIQEW